MAYPDGTVPTDETVHPTPVYETLAMGLGAFILWQLRDRFRAGILFAIYLVYAGTERLLVEFLRRNDDAAARPHPGPARERRDDRRRRDLARGRPPPPRHALPPRDRGAAGPGSRLNTQAPRSIPPSSGITAPVR